MTSAPPSERSVRGARCCRLPRPTGAADGAVHRGLHDAVHFAREHRGDDRQPGVRDRASLAFAGVAFTMVSLAENARVPVDNPATHLELNDDHEAMILE